VETAGVERSYMEYRESLIEAPDGRLLEVSTLGEPDGKTVFYHHGTPGSAVHVRSLARLTRRGLFLVSVSRPGYGYSSRREDRTVAAQLDDVRTVLDHLGRESYVSVGWSGGGPHSLACAALDAPRCIAAWSLAGIVPIDADFDWTAGMGPENIEEFKLARGGDKAYETHMARAGDRFAEATPENIIKIFAGLLSQVDKDALGDDAARSVLALACRQAFANGWRGFFDDDRAFFRSWGFDPSQIEIPVTLWYGDQDLMVPPSHGAWLARHVPEVVVNHVREDGHLSVVINHLDELASEISGAFISS
jgi:pimeloyl-ACP methyl ester carboxylesterase